MAFAMPDPVGQGEELRFIVNVANFGPDSAEDVEVEFALPAELQFAGAITNRTVTAKDTGQPQPRGSGSWNCADNTATVVCVLTGSVDTGFFAPTLELLIDVPTTAEPGVVSTDVTVSSAQNDPNPGNNSVSVEVEITGLSDGLFANGFECQAGFPDCPIVDPNIVDSGPVNLVTPAGGDNELNLVTGAFGPYGTTGAGADIKPYTGTGSVLYVYTFADQVEGQGTVTLDPTPPAQVAVLNVGDTIGPDSEITGQGQNNMQHWLAGTSGYIGVRFFNESTGAFNYGYLEVETGGPSGFPMTIKRYVYNSAGEAITIEASDP